MKIPTFAIAGVVLSFASMAHAGWDQNQAVQEAQKQIVSGKDPLPGPRTCF